MTHLVLLFCVFAVSEQMDRAFSLSLAALLGEDVYNFGELVCLSLQPPDTVVPGYQE